MSEWYGKFYNTCDCGIEQNIYIKAIEIRSQIVLKAEILLVGI